MLSIIIPAKNEEKHLPLLLNEIEEQSFKDLEVIVADANSEDKTVEIAYRFGCKITLGGMPAKGRNEGAKIAQGDIFLFMDADNIFLPPRFLENLLKEFERRNLDVASFTIYAKGNFLDHLFYGMYNFWTELTQSFLPHAVNSVLVKKEIHEAIGGFDEEIKLGEDHAYVRKAAKVGKFGFIKTEPVLTSARRYKKEGRLKTYTKYFLAGIYVFFLGNIKSDIFKYRFGASKRKRNDLR
jgi:glycosyltransferase involved in cell wall biosynthesis